MKFFQQQKHFNILFLSCIIITNQALALLPKGQGILRVVQPSLKPHYLKKLLPDQLSFLHSQEVKEVNHATQKISMYQYKPSTNKLTLSTYLLLQQRMALPYIIPLLQLDEFLHSAEIFKYDSIFAAMVIDQKKFNKLLPTLQCHSMLQALRYAQQHFTSTSKSTRKLSLDAEYFATKTMQCPACLHILSTSSPYGKDNPYPCYDDSRFSYFTKQDFHPFINNALAKKHGLCKAHQSVLRNPLHKLDPKEIDFENKSLLDRIPERIQPVPFYSRPPKI